MTRRDRSTHIQRILSDLESKMNINKPTIVEITVDLDQLDSDIEAEDAKICSVCDLPYRVCATCQDCGKGACTCTCALYHH